jgi:hypothetical protein
MTIGRKRNKAKGIGMWSHNNRALNDEEYCSKIEDTIRQSLTEHDDPVIAWSWMQCRVRPCSMKYGKQRAKESRDERASLERLYLRQLHEVDQEAINTAIRLQRFYHDEDAAIRFRAKVETAESDEKASHFFFARIKQNELNSNIGNITTDKYPAGTTTKAETMDAIESHYKDAFTDSNPSVSVPSHWWDGLSKLSPDKKDHFDTPFTLNDYTTVLFKDMSLVKSPGSDGLTVAFYCKFWHILAIHYVKSMQKCIERGLLSNSLTESVIRLIAKKGKDQSTLKGYRPISLMNVDAKIYSKAIAKRLKVVCDKVLGPEQLAYLGERHMQDAVPDRPVPGAADEGVPLAHQGKRIGT